MREKIPKSETTHVRIGFKVGGGASKMEVMAEPCETVAAGGVLAATVTAASHN
jgi:hypothetical protein